MRGRAELCAPSTAAWPAACDSSHPVSWSRSAAGRCRAGSCCGFRRFFAISLSASSPALRGSTRWRSTPTPSSPTAFHLPLTVSSAQRLASFMNHLDSNLAREAGRLIDWREKFWGRRSQVAAVSREDDARIARLRYVLAHGVREGLVGSPLEWPGAHSAGAAPRQPSRRPLDRPPARSRGGAQPTASGPRGLRGSRGASPRASALLEGRRAAPETLRCP